VSLRAVSWGGSWLASCGSRRGGPAMHSAFPWPLTGGERSLADGVIAARLPGDHLEAVLGARLQVLRRDAQAGGARRQVDLEGAHRIAVLEDDLVHDDESAAGTEVIIKIPVRYN